MGIHSFDLYYKMARRVFLRRKMSYDCGSPRRVSADALRAVAHIMWSSPLRRSSYHLITPFTLLCGTRSMLLASTQKISFQCGKMIKINKPILTNKLLVHQKDSLLVHHKRERSLFPQKGKETFLFSKKKRRERHYRR